MRLFLTVSAAVLAATALSAAGGDLGTRSLTELENRLAEINVQLQSLANYGLGGGIGAIGYRTDGYKSPDRHKWIRIDFGAEVPLDEVMLIPAIRRDAEKGYQADAFPAHIRLKAGTDADTNGTVVAEYTGDAQLNPGIAPFIIPCGGMTASWIQVESDRLNSRAFDGLYVFQFSEILAFSGEENVALKKPVIAQTAQARLSTAWSKEFVVDGIVPYLMDAASGEQSVGYLAMITGDLYPSLTFDLGETVPISRVQLHAVDASDTLPQGYAGDIGIPRELLVEGAKQADFSDARILLSLRHETIYDIGSIMTHHFPETPCRYVRLSMVEPSENSFYGINQARFGFSEVEIFSHGRNVALGAPVTPNYPTPNPHRPLINLTDGRNMFGDILPIREWLTQLALRHQLETERPLIEAELSRRYARQKTNLRRTGWLAALLAVGTIITILIDRIIRQRAVFRTRERIAADLHDELGANLHAIGLLSDLASGAKNTPEKLDKFLQRLRALTERTGAAARYCTNMLEAPGLYEDLVEDMRKTSARIMADLDYNLEFEGEEFLKQLKQRRKIDLFLFYKECLINIIRHSGATEVQTRLKARPDRLELTITDNGHGLDGEIPASLKRRARLLGAHLSTAAPSDGGTEITLALRPGKFGFRK